MALSLYLLVLLELCLALVLLLLGELVVGSVLGEGTCEAEWDVDNCFPGAPLLLGVVWLWGSVPIIGGGWDGSGVVVGAGGLVLLLGAGGLVLLLGAGGLVLLLGTGRLVLLLGAAVVLLLLWVVLRGTVGRGNLRL